MSYTCPTCSTFVPDGLTHYCSGYRATPNYYQSWSPLFDNAALQRIAVALERLVVLLEPKKPTPKAVKKRG